MKWGHEKFTNRGGGAEEKSVSDGMIESASTDIKYELKRVKIRAKRLDTSFIYLGFSNLTSWAGINRRNQPKAQEKEKTLLINKG